VIAARRYLIVAARTAADARSWWSEARDEFPDVTFVPATRDRIRGLAHFDLIVLPSFTHNRDHATIVRHLNVALQKSPKNSRILDFWTGEPTDRRQL
jgi:hypothetical protein